MTPVRSFCLVTVALIVSVSSICAQTRVNNSGTGGINIIKGQIYSAGGTRADGQVTVRLQGFSLGGELTLQTDQSGGFEFRSLSPGTYIVVVDAGDNFEIFRESVTIDPNVQIDPNVRVPPTPKSYTVPVYLRLKQNQSEKASVVNAKLAAVPKDAVNHYEKGIGLMQAGQLDQALLEFRSAVQLYPSMSWAYTEMGKIYLKTGRLDEAASALATSLRYEPDDFDANIDYGVALYAKQDYAGAETQLTKAAGLNATAVTPHYYLGLLFIQTKSLEKARVELENAKRLKGDKNFPLVHRYLGDVYRTLSLKKEAVAELETYLKIAPNAKDAEHVRQTIAELKKQI